MRAGLQKALDNTETMYAQLVEIANEIVEEHTKDINIIIKSTTTAVQAENLSNDAIRQLILTLALKAYSFSEIKEKASLKAQCAEALRKEKYATEFIAAEGSMATKDSLATTNTSDEVLAETIYDLVASLFKTKQAELHSVIDALKTVLTTRLSEAKLAAE